MAEMEPTMSQSPSDDNKILPNPFGRIVGLPLDDDEIDVAEINREAFASCQRLIHDVRNQQASAALTLFGEAGAGKTHLLGRVRRWLREVPESLFVLVRMDTNARMLWRHLQRSLADALLRPNASGRRPLDELLRARESECRNLSERDLGIVLENLLQGLHQRDSAAWLRGQELPDAALQRLELAQPNTEEDQEAAARNKVVSLCSLLEPGVVVFCLDQWEALQSFVGDSEGLLAASQAVWVLHDKVRNACIISCVQTGFMQRLETAVDVAIRRRMLSGRQGIDLLDWDKAQRLIAARLDSIPALAGMRRGQGDRLWPLAEPAVRQVFVDGLAPAGKVISRCKDLFDQWRGSQRPSEEPLEDVLQTMLEERMKPVEAADAETAFRNGLPVMLNSLGASPRIPRNETFDFSLHNGKQQIALCNQTNGRSLEARLKKVGEAWDSSTGDRLLLLRDARLPIGPNARVTRQRLKSIEEKGGRFVTVSQEAVESLAALRRLLADAQSGDLAHRGELVPSSSVERWIAGHLPSALDPLISEIEAPDLLSPRLADLLAQRKIVSLEDAARQLEVRPEEVESCARRDPRLCGVLGGATPALFQLVETESVQSD